MFPAELATGLCSLNPNVDRLVQSCLMEIDRHGNVVRYEIHDGVINSDARMTYTDVNAILADRDEADDDSIRRARADVRVDAGAVRDSERAPPATRLDRFRPAGNRGRALGAWRDRSDHSFRAQRRSPDHRGVHAPGQRNGGIASGREQRAGAPPHPRATGRVEGRGVRGVHRDPRLRPGCSGTRVAAEALPEADRSDSRRASRAADRGIDASSHAKGPVRCGAARPLRAGGGALYAFHVADSPVSRSRRASHAAAIAAEGHDR